MNVYLNKKNWMELGNIWNLKEIGNSRNQELVYKTDLLQNQNKEIQYDENTIEN